MAVCQYAYICMFVFVSVYNCMLAGNCANSCPLKCGNVGLFDSNEKKVIQLVVLIDCKKLMQFILIPAKKICCKMLLLQLSLLATASAQYVLTPPYFNIAENRPITANATCGEGVVGKESYCKLVGGFDRIDETWGRNKDIIDGQVQ